jgi:uncharacterized membrane protein (TIGR02234 family)
VNPGRRLAVTLAALALSAFGLWLATRLVWLRTSYQSPLRGALSVQSTGAEVRPELAAVALVAVAAAAAVVATSGWPRRLVGGLVAAAGAWAVWMCWRWPAIAPAPGSGGSGAGAEGAASSAPHPPADAVVVGLPERTAAPLLGVAAGLVLLAAAIGLVCWANSMPRLGSRYAAPGTARRVPDRDSQWWNALDAGEDPTLSRPPTDPGAPR